jgi:hypothetical protein
VQPGEAAFDDPADLAQPGAVGHAVAGMRGVMSRPRSRRR